MSTLARWALRAYPPSFRERYGDELAAVADEVTPSWRITADLYAGAARAWVRPAFPGSAPTRRRLQASVTTVWVAWCAGFLLVPAMSKALLDPPGSNVDATVRWLLAAAEVLFVGGWVAALGGVAVVVSRALVPRVRGAEWAVLRPLVPAVVIAVAEATGVGFLAVAARSGAPRATTAEIALAIACAAGLALLVLSVAVGPVVTLSRLSPDLTVLRAPTRLAALLSLCLIAMTLASAAAALRSGDARLVGSVVPVFALLVVAGAAGCTAVVSAGRGVLALRRQS